MRGLGVPPAAWQYFRMEDNEPTSNPETVAAMGRDHNPLLEQFFEPYFGLCQCSGSPRPEIGALLEGLTELIDERIRLFQALAPQTPGKAATGE